MPKISVAVATYNEEENIVRCLESVVLWADEIVVVDGGSTDRTVELAKRFKAKIIQTDNPPIFHINKQKALNACQGDWILQLDADEVVSEELAQEIKKIISLTKEQIEKRHIDSFKKHLFERHQALVEERDGKIGAAQGAYVAFFVPRRNYFLGHPMKFAGAYPDGVIRLIKRGKAWFPAKSVHEQIQVKGKVGWLYCDLLHFSNPTLDKYIKGADKYTSLLAQRLRHPGLNKKPVAFFEYMFFRPIFTFVNLFIRHKGFLDGVYGFLFALFSALHYPIAYSKYFKTMMNHYQ